MPKPDADRGDSPKVGTLDVQDEPVSVAPLCLPQTTPRIPEDERQDALQHALQDAFRDESSLDSLFAS